jgi:ankyrin repeat protein
MYYSKKYKREKINALTKYIKNTHSDQEVLAYLNNQENTKAIDINKGSENEPWLSPLMLCSSRGRTKSIRKLLEMNADVNTTNQFQYTPLMWVATDGDIEAIQCLIDYGAKLDMVNDKDQTAINLAFQEYEEEAFKLLVNNIRDVHTIKLVEANFDKDFRRIRNMPRVDLSPEDYINSNIAFFEIKKSQLLLEEKLERELQNKQTTMKKIKL